MSYVLNNQVFDEDADSAQGLLQVAHKQGVRPLCGCKRPMPEMYIARGID